MDRTLRSGIPGALEGAGRPSVTWPEKAAVAILALPVALFFASWFQPWLGFPAAAVALWSGWVVMRGMRGSPLPSRRALGGIALVSLVWTWTSGMGGMYQQMWDHNFRNALLHDLINHPWPVFWETPRGVVVLDYYLAWSMFPALVGKLLGWRAATLAMAALCATGIFLVLLVFVRVVGVWRWWVPLVFVLWSGLDIVGWGLRRQFPDVSIFIESWALPLWYLGSLINYYCVAHLAIPAWLVVLLLAGRRVARAHVVALSAFLVPLAPFPALGIAPFVAWRMLRGEGTLALRLRGALTPVNVLVPLVFVAVCAPYFLANQGASLGGGWIFGMGAEPTKTVLLRYVAFLLLEVLVPAAAIWMVGVRERLLLLVVAVLCLVPLRQAGMSNDFALKVSIPGLAILTLLTARGLVSTRRGWTMWFLVGVFSIGVATPLHEFWAATNSTLADPSAVEEDHLGTFDPADRSSPVERRLAINFLSVPLQDRPLLRGMLRGQ